jgi:AcrR family transcriptional regulator
MGHREDLLDGAVRCLYEKGYARTTARDIVEASGTNLGSIGYHYGGLQNLLNAALERAVENWGLRLAEAMMTTDVGARTGIDRFEAYWATVLATVEQDRPVLMATFDAMVQIDHAPALRKMLADGLHDARGLWAQAIHGIDPELEPVRANQVGSFYQALISGVLAQVLIDPDRAPDAADLSAALRSIVAAT